MHTQTTPGTDSVIEHVMAVSRGFSEYHPAYGVCMALIGVLKLHDSLYLDGKGVCRHCTAAFGRLVYTPCTERQMVIGRMGDITKAAEG